MIKASMSQGGTLRVATWNIERGLEFDALKAALTNDQGFFRRLPATMRGSLFNLADILEQVAALSSADIVILNESDGVLSEQTIATSPKNWRLPCR